MKTLLLAGLALCSLFAAPLNAAEVKKKPKPPATPVLFGGWAAGKTFSYTVTDVVSSAVSGVGGTAVPVPVPKGIPAYTLGERVTFTIGKKGELTGPKGLKIVFNANGVTPTSNSYVNLPTAKAPTPHVATVWKNSSTNEPTGGVALTFFQVKRGKGFNVTVTTVNYMLQ